MNRHRFVALLLAILLALPVLSGAAQTPEADLPTEEDLAGLQATVWRDYAPIQEDPKGWPIAFSVLVREFDTADNAAVAFERIVGATEATLDPEGTDLDVEITREDLDGIGNQAARVVAVATEDGESLAFDWVTVQRDQYLFNVVAVTLTGTSATPMASPEAIGVATPEGSEASTSAVELATAISAGEASPDEPALIEDGTSTGGLWGFMLPADDPLLAGVEAITDTVLFPIPEE